MPHFKIMFASTPAFRCKSFISHSFSIAPKPSSQLAPSLRHLRQTTTPKCRPYCGSSHHHQNQNSNSAHDPPNAVQVPPPPSWSVRELRLTSSSDDDDDKISNEELATLARRCLIDVRRLSPERRDKLRVHVAGIMRCASVLLDARNLDVEGSDANGRGGREEEEGDGPQLTDEQIYDAPRGLKKIPIRIETEDDWKLHDAGESKAVMQSEGVTSKMEKEENGEQMFFSVITKR
mmetsp:Transcript_22628/g.47686  ORF Transcript_22628/g.47686 Transcript_22628/m.47686 type:complete len:234 (+) Transcript_22628:39-740(+)